MKYSLFLVITMQVLACSLEKSTDYTTKPNILLIVADDMGYSDLGCFGSEIRTPNIDQLASEGILFTQFHAGPQCAPSRAMLISGSDNHMAGVGRQDVPKESKWYGQRGYERNLSDRIIPFPELLQEAGYFTCMSGKWHLGYDSLSWPHLKGFDRSFGMLNGGSSHYSGMGLGVEVIDTLAQWVKDGQRANYPDGTYATELHTDNLIKYISESDKKGGQPFFAYAAYTSPHWPLQVPDDYRDRYQGVYDEGYEVLKERRFQNLKDKGFINNDLNLPPYADKITPWYDLTHEEQEVEARKMELYAAMVENLDHHIGRLRDSLEQMGKWGNTTVFFISDNGAAHRDFYAHPDRGQYLRSKYDNSYGNMGRPNSFVSYGKAWAMSTMVPYKLHKSFTTEGGMIVPAILSGVGVKKVGRINQDYANIMDIAPTILQIAGVSYSELFGASNKPQMRGKSLFPIMKNNQASIYGDEDIVALEFNGSIFLQKGDWKLVNYKKPYSADGFELFNIADDSSEMNDLRTDNPQEFEELYNIWLTYQKQNKILLQDAEDARKFNY